MAALRERAAREPDRVAVWDERRALTYAELDALAGTLATTLAEHRSDLGACGVLPIVVDRDVASVVAIFAALRAGIAFATVDAHAPARMTHSLLARIDDPAVAVVAASRFAATLPADTAAIAVPDRAGAIIDPIERNVDALGQIVFTSGSSGTPKGVALAWRTLDAFATDPILAVPNDVEDFRFAAVAPFSFVAGTSAAYRIARGGAMSIVDPNAHDPLTLLERFDAERLNHILVAPSHAALVAERWPAGRRLAAARSAMTFGEALEWSTVAALRRLLPEDAFVASVYSATEAGQAILAWVADARTPLGVGRTPIGRPVEDGLIRLEPLSANPEDPMAAVLRGPRLALGYWRDPELTARTFGVDPDGVRYWRSGDLVRRDDDGQFHFAGRSDNVVKINGRLVEPSEPERVLGSVPGVRRAVVLVQPAPRGGQRLVGHVEVDATAPVSPTALRATLSDQVAAHLVPAVLVRHDRLPITDRGKVDRQALVAADVVPWWERASDREPMTFELAVLDVVGQIVGHRAIGPDDDLWAAGLDSLGAVELLAALADFGWPALPTSTLVEHRTAAALNTLRGGMLPTAETIWLHAGAAGAPVLCVLPPSSDALTFRRFAQEVGTDHPVAIARQFDPVGEPMRTVEEIAGALVDRHAPALAGRSPVLVGYSASGVVAYEAGRLLRERGEAARVLLLDAPAGVRTARRMRQDAPRTGRRLRTAARQAWLRALPAMTLPQRERAFALFEIASKAALRHTPVRSDVPVTLFLARSGGIDGLVEDWSGAAADLTVVDLDCDHMTILDLPAIADVARRVRQDSPAPPL